ncbi:MAG: hypothetical protein N3F64_06095 [Nitrososphaeria archaeon]|nr:hypothetical protein [Nitrososphaeria archaeon]
MYTTQEIGSMPKPRWLINYMKKIPIIEKDFREIEYWGKFLEIENYKELIEILKQNEEYDEVKKWAITFTIRFFEKSGLDIVYTGEVLRKEMYEHAASKIGGFKFLGEVQSLDNKYYNIANVVEEVYRREPIYLEEFKIAKNIAKKELKVPIIGPYTLAEWSLNQYYYKKALKKINSIKEAKIKAKEKLIFSLIENVYRDEVRELVENGATWIQIDEPAATTHPNKEEMLLFVEGYNQLTKNFHIKFSLHNCYSNYQILSKYIPLLKNCHQLALEFANRDTLNLGLDEKSRIGYNEIKQFIENGYEGSFGVGVLHVLDYEGEKSEFAVVEDKTLIESVNLIRDRLDYAAKIVGDPSKITANPDCGLRTRKEWNIIWKKLSNMVKAAKML